MTTQYTVITDNGGGPNQIYHDVAGEIYTFPPMYRNKLTPGTKVVYHRAKKKKEDAPILDRLSDESHYFGIAEIGSIAITSNGNLRATIKNFSKFRYPVMIHRTNGEYYEIKPFFQQGVRSTTKQVYDDICQASEIKPAPKIPNVCNRGVRTFKILTIGISSNVFDNGKYQVVTSRNGYYLKNLADGVYYELGRVRKFGYSSGRLRVLSQIPKAGQTSRVFYIRHEQSSTIVNVGFLEPITNGLSFKGKIDGQDIKVNLLL